MSVELGFRTEEEEQVEYKETSKKAMEDEINGTEDNVFDETSASNEEVNPKVNPKVKKDPLATEVSLKDELVL